MLLNPNDTCINKSTCVNMVIYLSRFEEEKFLLNPNDTCINKNNCVTPTKKKGRAIKSIGKCVLCCRFEATKKFEKKEFSNIPYNLYINFDYDYNDNYYLDNSNDNIFKNISGPFIRYNELDYSIFNDGIIQNFNKKNIHINLKWFENMIDINRSIFSNNLNFNIAICSNTLCKKNFKTILDKQSSKGVENCIFNLKTKIIECENCEKPIKKIYSNSYQDISILNYRNKSLTICLFCGCAIYFNVKKSTQTCTGCSMNLKKRWCMYLEKNKKLVKKK